MLGDRDPQRHDQVRECEPLTLAAMVTVGTLLPAAPHTGDIPYFPVGECRLPRRPTAKANEPFAVRQFTAAKCRCGSISTEIRCPRYVRFPPDRDQIADVSALRFRAES